MAAISQSLKKSKPKLQPQANQSNFDDQQPTLPEDIGSASTPEFSKLEKTNNWIMILGCILLILILSMTAVFVLIKIRYVDDSQITTLQTVQLISNSNIATISAQPVLNRQAWTFEVLNGSGRRGEAKLVSDKLSSQGYTVVNSGNADKSYQKSELIVNAKLASILESQTDLLLRDLSVVLKVATSSSQSIDSTASARLIIGRN